MNKPKLIERTGTVSFHDASLNIWEEGEPAKGQRCGLSDEWEKRFKREVFTRIVQQLNRLGWTCAIPQEYVERYGASFARDRRECSKGDLKGWLEIGGRTMKFEMWQGVNTPTRPDHGGRYESNKEAVAPYLLRLEMHRTRTKIRDYLCNVFTDYTFKPPQIDSPSPDPLAYFNSSWDGEYERKRGVHRFGRDDTGKDVTGGWPTDKELGSWGREDRDGVKLQQGDVRWYRNHKGVLLRGRVYGGINGMWFFVYGPSRRDIANDNAKAYFTYRAGETPPKVITQRLRRKRLEQELNKAVAAMNFVRAQAIKTVLFPEGPLYAIWHKGHKSFFGINYSGYRERIDDAGRYTRAELKPYLGDALETNKFKAVVLEAAA